MKIRNYQTKDEIEIIKLVIELQDFEGKLEKDRVSGNSIKNKYFDSELKPLLDGGGNILVAVSEDDHIVGYCSYEVNNNEDIISNFDKVMHIQDMIVSAKFRGKGIASLFVERLKEIAMQNNIKTIMVNTLAKNNQMRSFLSMHGFSEYEITLITKLD